MNAAGNTTHAELEELEHRGWEALSGPGGVTFYNDVMASDGVMIFPGTIMDKQEALAAIADAAPWSTFALEHLKVIEQGPDAGVVVYYAIAQREGSSPYRAWMSSAYVRREGRWLLVVHQQTPGG